MLPNKLIVSGCKSPTIGKEKKIAELPNEQFCEEVSSLGGISDDVKNCSELLEYIIL